MERSGLGFRAVLRPLKGLFLGFVRAVMDLLLEFRWWAVMKGSNYRILGGVSLKYGLPTWPAVFVPPLVDPSFRMLRHVE